MVKPVKDEFQADWGAAADVNIPQPEVTDVSFLFLSSSATDGVARF